MIFSNDYIYNHNFHTYLSYEGYLERKFSGLTGVSIPACVYVDAITSSHQCEGSV